MPRTQVDFGASSRPIPGESVCGDRYVVAPFAGGVLIAVIDALGHGKGAAETAALAEKALCESPGENVIALVKHCHDALRGTRGTVMSLARFDTKPRTLTWVGIGNVEGVLVQSGRDEHTAVRARLLNRGGVVGSSLPPLRAEVIDVSGGGLLIFSTDGVEAAFADVMTMDARPVQVIADDLLRRHGKDTDDALVLTARLKAGMGK